MNNTVVVTGAGGFIGHHLVKYLVRQGRYVRGVDIKHPEYEPSPAQEFEILDLRRLDNCLIAARGAGEVYNLAADMGGIGFITGNHAIITRNSIMINVHMLEAARLNAVERFLFSSSACVYPQHLQKSAGVTPLTEDLAWPADPEEGYGLEKLFTEKMCEYYTADLGIETRVVRFHNVYGPLGTYDGGREKSPAAICRKVALSPDPGEIEVWGDGQQTRSYMFIDDCLQGIHRLMQSDYRLPLNLGTVELVSADRLVDIAAECAAKDVTKRFYLTKPQ